MQTETLSESASRSKTWAWKTELHESRRVFSACVVLFRVFRAKLRHTLPASNRRVRADRRTVVGRGCYSVWCFRKSTAFIFFALNLPTKPMWILKSFEFVTVLVCQCQNKCLFPQKYIFLVCTRGDSVLPSIQSWTGWIFVHSKCWLGGLCALPPVWCCSQVKCLSLQMNDLCFQV